MSAALADEDDPVAAYKRLLKALVARRPSGTRKRLAEAFGAHPSFVSQVLNPALRVPLPAQHLPALFKVGHFSSEERAQFLALYARAHPAQAAAREELAAIERDVIRLPLPAFSDPALRAEVEETIRDFAERVIRLALRTSSRRTPEGGAP